jgi:triacylglycerol lipase
MELSPIAAVTLAKAAYSIRTESNIDRAVREVGGGAVLEMFDAGKAQIVSGSSGAGWRQSSGFSLLMAGRGAWQGQYVVATRGTATLADGLSDLVAALERGPGGMLVHAGFNRVATSVLPALLAALRNKNPSRIHVVGHSLGGGVSNLLAAQFDKTVGGSTLYTFGSPRVGQDSFVSELTWSLGDKAIHRAFNISDVVPMVPIFPFSHAPFRSEGALVGQSHGLISLHAHSLDTYAPALVGQTWQGLKNRATVVPMSVDQLLDQAAEAVRFPGAGLALRLLSRVLAALLASTNVILGSSVTSGMTLLDRMAWMLVNCARISVDMAKRVQRFIEYVMRFLGRPVLQGVNLTGQIVTYVLQLLMAHVRGVANAALRRGA